MNLASDGARPGRLAMAALFLAVLFAPAGSFNAQAAAAEYDYELRLVCPHTTPSNPRHVVVSTGSRWCPVRAIDEGDAMGDPTLGVDPDVPSNMIIASLHNWVQSNGPTPKARCCIQPFTTFVSHNGGASWVDNPFRQHTSVSKASAGSAFGITTSITIDPYGHAYIGSMYAMRSRESSQRFDYVIVAQKFAGLNDVNVNQDGEFNSVCLTPLYKGNRMTDSWFVFDPAADRMVVVWHERLTEHTTNDFPPDPCDEAAPPSATPGQPRSVIGLASTGSSVQADYEYARRSSAIGPCTASTNPVVQLGWLYVGCVVDTAEGPFTFDPNVADGTLTLFRLRPNGDDVQYLGQTPIVGGLPRLGVRSDGLLVAATAGPSEAGRLTLHVSFGALDPNTQVVRWAGLVSLGEKVSTLDPSIQLASAAIQGLEFREYSGAVHIILKQVLKPNGFDTSAMPGPLRATLASNIRKSLIAVDEKHGLLATVPFDIGSVRNRSTDSSLQQMDESAFDDQKDGILQLPAKHHEAADGYQFGNYPREFIAVGDYGQVQIAEVEERTDLRGPAFANPPPAPPAIPAAAGSGTLTSVLVPAAGLSVAGLMALAFLMNRRKSIATARSKMKK